MSDQPEKAAPLGLCPTCRRPLSGPIPSRSEELLRLLKSGDRDRDVYRIDRSQKWALTYLRAGPTTYQHFDWNDVAPLVARGLIERTYAECVDSFSLPHRAAANRQKMRDVEARRAARTSPSPTEPL